MTEPVRVRGARTAVDEVRPPVAGGVVSASADPGGLSEAVQRLPLHSHVGLLCEDAAEGARVVVPFVRAGLEREERCLCIVDESSRGEVAEALIAGDVDVERHVRSGALQIVGKERAYLAHGVFDPRAMIDGLVAATEAAVADGHSALRISGEMAWIASAPPGAQRAFEYEALVGRFFRDHPALAVCQYRVAAFRADQLLQAIRTHPVIIARGRLCENPYYVPPEELLAADPARLEVERLLTRLTGRRDEEDRLQQGQFELERANAALRSLAVTDDLTGLLNRRGLVALAEKVAALARREERSLLAIYLDVDGLKEVNDTYGHAAGDGLLVETARMLADVFRESDVIARVGGDEFVVVMAGDGTGVAETAMARFQDAVSRRNARTLQPYVMSVSAGAARADPGASADIDALLARADAAMYAEKRRRGRQGR